MQRRHFLAASSLPLFGCAEPGQITGGFTGINHERGHLLRDGKAWPAPSVVRKTRVLIAGGGVAGLAAARALRLRGIDDFALLELEDAAGGNSRGGAVNGIACPLGAHYLPVPGDDAHEVQDVLEELGLRKRVAGRWVYDERHLCHSPQERLFFKGEWQDGLLPLQGINASTLAQYQQFSALVEVARKASHWRIPASKSPLSSVQIELNAITFVAYLDRNGLTDQHLRWYLDYCCRDDYGAGIATVSAWAGIHYFASRHGFSVPGAASVEREGVLTWPEGNAWLTRRMAAPLKERLHTGQIVLRIANTRGGVELDAFNTATRAVERWQASHAIVALPIFVAARVVQNPPEFLRLAAQRTVYAPWLVANIHIKTALHDRPGPAPSWDNVLYGTAGLGYVDASHQSLRPVPGATVLTHYRALGDVPGGALAGRRLLMNQSWDTWRDEILAELSVAHPDLAGKTTRIDITRYGHAMAVPVPRNMKKIGLQPPNSKHGLLLKKERLVLSDDRLRFAHSDWAGYSVFEEAFTLGHGAGTSTMS
ncbi:FAD-dependent oxidoreductase [Rhodoferax sp.]|uniref:FAD-dependent oxidoreductase n=1 Tax=Rhodoferax sp. TaxID=50421 RepID=UPI001ECC998D|nr:FAD-dependent oxidoreductase [Rhodoferax sp.]MBT9505182.1 FAD-dependent oxidoreductase [Rhodoferax sp.]